MVFSLHAKCFRSLVTHLQWLPYEKWLTKRQPLFVNFDFRNVSFLHENCSWALLFLFPESSFFIPLNILQMQFDQMKTFHCIEKFNFLFTTKFLCELQKKHELKFAIQYTLIVFTLFPINWQVLMTKSWKIRNIYCYSNNSIVVHNFQELWKLHRIKWYWNLRPQAVVKLVARIVYILLKWSGIFLKIEKIANKGDTRTYSEPLTTHYCIAPTSKTLRLHTQTRWTDKNVNQHQAHSTANSSTRS